MMARFRDFKGNPPNGAKVDKINGFWRIFNILATPFSNPPWALALHPVSGPEGAGLQRTVEALPCETLN